MNTDEVLELLKGKFLPFECKARTTDHGEFIQIKIIDERGKVLTETCEIAREHFGSLDQVNALIHSIRKDLRDLGHFS